MVSKNFSCLISAGPTREWIDPVRYISNPSSGKMGYALASEAKKRCFNVRLVSGPVHLSRIEGISTYNVETADEMSKFMNKFCSTADIVIMCAAVSDHKPKTKSQQKIKKNSFPTKIEMIENEDILKNLGKQKVAGQILLGFAAETENFKQNALEKLNDKNLDWIAMNDISDVANGFNSDKNEITMFSALGEEFKLESCDKRDLATKIFDIILK